MSPHPINSNIKRYFLADIISQFGSGMGFVGLNWFIFQKTGTSQSVGILISIAISSGLITLFFAGFIIDNFRRKNILILSKNYESCPSFRVNDRFIFIPFKMIYLYALAVVDGIGWNLYLPASSAFLQEIANTSEIHNGNSLLEISLQTSMFTAEAISGVIYKFLGMQAIFGVIFCCFIISTIVLLTINKKSEIIKIRDRESLSRECLKGVSYYDSCLY